MPNGSGGLLTRATLPAVNVSAVACPAVVFAMPLGSLRPNRHSGALGTDALQKHAGGLIVRVLRHEFAPERLGEDGLVEMIDQLAGAGRFGREAINPGEGGLDTTNNRAAFILAGPTEPQSPEERLGSSFLIEN